MNDLIKSPLNYTGGKYKLLDQILPMLPDSTNRFIDLFCGGCNVGINAKFNEVIFIDNQKQLMRLFETFKDNDKDYILHTIENIINTYGLSQSSRHGYDYYNCSSSNGLGEYNKINFLKMRKDYNCREEDNFYNDILFYTIIIFAFNNQIRFNKMGKCNIPVGKRDFNDRIRKNLLSFIDRIEDINAKFVMSDFREFEFYDKEKDTVIYADPPYLISNAAYNEQDGWNDKKEKALLELLDYIHSKKIKFALSNVIESKGIKNEILINWSRKYNVNHLDFSYKNSNYQKKSEHRNAKNIEVLITNY